MLQLNNNIEDMITQNQEGVFEWKHPDKWNRVFLEYFENRKDDSLSTEIITVSLTS